MLSGWLAASGGSGVGACPGRQGQQGQDAGGQGDRCRGEQPEVCPADEGSAGRFGEQAAGGATDPGRDIQRAADRAEDGGLDRVRQMVGASAAVIRSW